MGLRVGPEVADGETRGAVGVLARDELAHLDGPGETTEHWENNGFCIRVSDGEHEFLLWLAFYILRGTPAGRFAVGDVRVDQAIAVHGAFPASERAAMNDTPFAATGVHWSEYRAPAELRCALEGDAAVWQLGGRRHECAPPRWRIAGSAGRLVVDLELEALAPVSWFSEFELIEGFETLARVEGTIATGGRTYVVRGVAQHEKVHTAVPIQRRDGAGFATLPVDQRHIWHVGAGRELAFSVLANQPGERAEVANGQLVVRGRQLGFGRDALRVDETALWHDPRSGVTVPAGWRIEVDLADGLLELDVTAYARAYYLWDYLRGSTSLLYWLLADADARWTPAGGGGFVAERLLYAAHTNRPFLYWG